MPFFKVQASSLKGSIIASPSKSHSLRAILFASIAKGKSEIRNYLTSPDLEAMISACQQLGAEIKKTDEVIEVVGTNHDFKNPDDVINCGNSGQVLRFVAGLAALMHHYVVLTGDHSIRHNRAAQPLIEGLTGLDVFCVSTKNDGHAPIIVKGPLQPGKTQLLGHDSQPVSALLIACAFAQGASEIIVYEPGEKPWIDMTLSWFDRLGIIYQNDNYERYTMAGQSRITAFDYQVPGDFSSIAFPIVAALITHSEITIHNVDMNDAQGDKKIIYYLKKMGAQIEIDETTQTLHIKKTDQLIGMTINVNDMIDAVPILAVVGCYAKGTTILADAGIAREKECDRLSAMTQELKKMGADITEGPDSLTINHSSLSGTTLSSFHDHRIVMSLVVAALAAKGESMIEGVEWVKKSYPEFFKDISALNASIEIIS